MRTLVLVTAVVALTAPGQFLQAHQTADGGFAEPSGRPTPALTAWAALGLVADGRGTGRALEYLLEHEPDTASPATRALVALAAAALGDPRLAEALPVRAGRTNTVIWTILARRQAGLAAPRSLVRLVLGRQARNGGWGWARGIAPDTNDTAAAVQALAASGVGGAPIRRGLAYLDAAHNADGGFGLMPQGPSDAESTAWAIQAYAAAGVRAPRGALVYLQRLRQPDGSFRHSARYAVTPVWVTAQVLPALARRPFPLRPPSEPAAAG